MISMLTVPLGPVSLLAAIAATLISMSLSSRLGAVTKMQPYYRGFWVAVAFLVVALTAYIVRNTAYLAADMAWPWLLSPAFALAFFHAPLLIGIGISLALVWRYWSWLLSERG